MSNVTLISDLIGLAELGLEHREAAELDCESDRHTIATARKVMANAPSRGNVEITAETASRVRLANGEEVEVAVFDSGNGAFHHRRKWMDRGYFARTTRKSCGGIAVLVSSD